MHFSDFLFLTSWRFFARFREPIIFVEIGNRQNRSVEICRFFTLTDSSKWLIWEGTKLARIRVIYLEGTVMW